MSSQFTKFSLPDKAEGFDEIRCGWSKAKEAEDYIKNWILDRKLSIRIEDLKPSAWFSEHNAKVGADLQAWKAAQSNHKTALAKKASEKQAKKTKKLMEKRAADAKKAQAVAQKAAAKRKKANELAAKKAALVKAGKKEEADALVEEEEEEKEEEPAPEVEEEEEEEEADEPMVDFEAIDIFGLKDILDIQNGEPLCSNFGFEDWTLVMLRMEFHMLVHSFQKDCNDPERLGMHADHIDFYYQKYFKKQLNLRAYGVDDIKALVDLVGDCVYLDEKDVLQAIIPEGLETNRIFLKLAAESKNDRALRLDLGDETAKLKITQQAMPQPQPGMGARPPMQGMMGGNVGGQWGAPMKAGLGGGLAGNKQSLWGKKPFAPMARA